MTISPVSTMLANTAYSVLAPKITPEVSTASFAQQLAGTIEALLHQSGTSARIQVQIIAAGSGPESSERQFVVTISDSSSAAPTPSVKAPATATPGQPVTLMSIPIASPQQPSTPAEETAPVNSGPPPLTLANGKVVTNEYEAYWAMQPPEVQALMYAPNESKRMELARELADQGFQIDVPIMIWGWDPLTTMIVRRNQGYTWVPSANQDPVSVAPGINFPGLPSYDPKNAPDGSIAVSTDFAKGFEHTCPWPIDPQDLATV